MLKIIFKIKKNIFLIFFKNKKYFKKHPKKKKKNLLLPLTISDHNKDKIG